MADETPPVVTPSEDPAEPASAPQESSSLETTSSESSDATTQLGSSPTPTNASPTPPKKGGFKFLSGRFSIYLLLFVFVILVAVAVVVATYLHSRNTSSGNPATQTLSQDSLNQLSKSDVTVGDVKQTLNIQSNAVFAGGVLVRKDLQVAGKLQIGGSLSLSDINVTGDGTFDQIQVNKNFQVGGDTALQGQLTVQKSLNVNGGGTFSGALSASQLSVNTLQLNGDLNITHHITAGGATPGRTNGTALGGGGTASVSGSDTAGSISINTGSSPAAGCFITVNFTTKFNTTPHVVVTPVEAAAGGLQYYVSRTTSSFSVCTASAAPGGQSFGFDYIVFD